MREAKLPLAYRDSCASLLIPLNNCRFETYYLPWKCEVRLRGLYSLPNRATCHDGDQARKSSLRHNMHGEACSMGVC